MAASASHAVPLAIDQVSIFLIFYSLLSFICSVLQWFLFSILFFHFGLNFLLALQSLKMKD